MPGGGYAIICGGRGRRRTAKCDYCSRTHSYLCDFPVKGGKTCDAKICGECADEVGDDVHHCRIHRLRGDAEQRQLLPSELTTGDQP